jgi:hypothetical protein
VTSAQALDSSDDSKPPRPNEQSKLQQALYNLQTDPIVWLTLVLAILAGWQIAIYRRQLKMHETIERAYLALSHKPPGIVIDPLVLPNETIAKQSVGVYLGVKNLGNTPANVTYALIQLCASDKPLPSTPPYDRSLLRKMQVSTVKSDDFVIFQSVPIDLVTIEKIKKGTLKLYALGYADYIDKFKKRHRCGYARVYDPSADYSGDYWANTAPLEGMTFDKVAWANRSNLRFVTEPNYNYDRERKKGDGDDWDEPQK